MLISVVLQQQVGSAVYDQNHKNGKSVPPVKNEVPFFMGTGIILVVHLMDVSTIHCT
jgi:hypothetical protein